MNRTFIYQNQMIEYDLQYKKVKNINLRIKPDGKIMVSASKYVPQRMIDDFLFSKGDFILNVLSKYALSASKEPVRYFSEEEVQNVILRLCRTAYPYYKNFGIVDPTIQFRTMVSRWGSCHPTKGILTFNLNLMYAPRECIQYVVWHEFTHFLQANHSNKFYEELEKVCPDWKVCRKKLKEIRIL
ncbi:MAG: M48 family metallopeptidase [Ruminococcaceae bacterium]|nr:M48 family metallopeptidase [Oscillospiraceae bacterium]